MSLLSFEMQEVGSSPPIPFEVKFSSYSKLRRDVSEWESVLY